MMKILIEEFEQKKMNSCADLYDKNNCWNIMQGDHLIGHLERMGQKRFAPDSRPQDLYPVFLQNLQKHSFWELANDFSMHGSSLQKRHSEVSRIIFDTSNQFLWYFLEKENLEKTQKIPDADEDEDEDEEVMGYITPKSVISYLEKNKVLNLSGWILPSLNFLLKFRDASENPAKYGKDKYASYDSEEKCLYNHQYWFCADKKESADLSEDDGELRGRGFLGGVLAALSASRESQAMVYLKMQGEAGMEQWQTLRQQGLKLGHRTSNTLLEIPDVDGQADTRWSHLDFSGLWQALRNEGLYLQAEDAPDVQIRPQYDPTESLRDLDYTPCRLPRLEKSDLSDPNKGLWELWGQDEAGYNDLGVRARNPALDVRKQWVAIDFGTSSTVVAVATQSLGKELLRVGVTDAGDFDALLQAKAYENPTVLRFLDLDAFLPLWNEQVYRPALSWDWVRVAHAALTEFRDNLENQDLVVNSLLRYLKRWALESDRIETVICDQSHERELRLAPLQEQHPVRGQMMAPRGDIPMDPIELYAWYLGMSINWRRRGIYLKYAMTFPVSYPQTIRNRILASFARGLQRSLPRTLLEEGGYLNQFEVREISTEPMAYAVAMLPAILGDCPVEEVAYGVFDFGGGTTDFDFGLWRQPTDEEADDEGAESVFERLGSGGDPYLGGENLLALLAYRVLQDNAKALYQNQLVFTRPNAEAPFPGSELLLEESRFAQANTALLVEKLRPLLETPEEFTEDRATLDLFNRQGQRVSVTLSWDVEALQELLRERVEQGVDAFLREMSSAFAQSVPASLHILLAGNASRGVWVREAFDTRSVAWGARVERSFGQRAPEFHLHFAAEADALAGNAPHCKTGVALGALDLVPGSPILQRDRLQEASQGDAPFRYFLGGLRQGQLDPVLGPACNMGQWQELGPVRDGIFHLAWSASPRARNGLRRGDPELRVDELAFPAAGKGWRCFGRVLDPTTVELTVASSAEIFCPDDPGLSTCLSLDEMELTS